MISSTPIQGRRVCHIVLNVRALAPEVAFYCGVLGLRDVGRCQHDRVFLSATGENHHDLALREVGPLARAADGDAAGLCHVALKIGDSLELLRQARAAVASVEPPRL